MRGPDKNHQGRSVALTAIAALAALLLIPSGSHALTACTTPAATLCNPATNPGYYTGSDCDGDGYTDQQECEGFTTAGTNPRHIAGYLDTTATDKMDPSIPDLLYLLVDATLTKDITTTSPNLSTGQPSLLLQAMGNLTNGALNVYANGLKIRTHRINYADISGDRLTISGNTTTKAAMVVENAAPTVAGSTNPNDKALGLTKEGKTSAPGIYSTIYTNRIQSNVMTNCATDSSCSVKGTLPLIQKRADIINYYILQVTAHEMGHGSSLATANTDGLYHYSKSGTIMDPSTTYSRGVYTIPTNFDLVKDPPAVTLK